MDGNTQNDSRVSRWSMFAAGWAVACFVTYVGVLRPTMEELGSLHRRIGRFEESIEAVAALGGATDQANDLLSKLQEQERLARNASNSINVMRKLREQIEQEAFAVNQARGSLALLGDLKNEVLRAAVHVEEAAAAIAAIDETQYRLAKQQELPDIVETAMAAQRRLRGIVLQLEAGSEESRDSLTDLASLQHELIDHGYSTGAAREGLDNLVEVKEKAEKHVLRSYDAHDALDSLADLMSRVQANAEKVAPAAGVVKQWEALQENLAHAAPLVDEARETSRELISLEEELVYRASDSYDARVSLDDLLAIKDDLVQQGDTVVDAQDRAAELIDLKDRVLVEGDHVVDAVETLELISELQLQFERSADTFTQIRDWMGQLMVFEPSIRQAMDSLRPLTELGNLRRLSRGQLREVVSRIGEDRAATIASKPETTAGRSSDEPANYGEYFD